MRARHWMAAGLLLLAAACESATGPSPSAKPLHDGGGLMGSGTVVPPPPPPDTTTAP